MMEAGSLDGSGGPGYSLRAKEPEHAESSMSIVGFHRVLIGAAIAFCAFYAAWEFAQYQADGDGSRIVLGIVFAVLAVALGVYLALLGRFLGRKGAR